MPCNSFKQPFLISMSLNSHNTNMVPKLPAAIYIYLLSVFSFLHTVSSFRGQNHVFCEKYQSVEGREDEKGKGDVLFGL